MPEPFSNMRRLIVGLGFAEAMSLLLRLQGHLDVERAAGGIHVPPAQSKHLPLPHAPIKRHP